MNFAVNFVGPRKLYPTRSKEEDDNFICFMMKLSADFYYLGASASTSVTTSIPLPRCAASATASNAANFECIRVVLL